MKRSSFGTPKEGSPNGIRLHSPRAASPLEPSICASIKGNPMIDQVPTERPFFFVNLHTTAALHYRCAPPTPLPWQQEMPGFGQNRCSRHSVPFQQILALSIPPPFIVTPSFSWNYSKKLTRGGPTATRKLMCVTILLIRLWSRCLTGPDRLEIGPYMPDADTTLGKTTGTCKRRNGSWDPMTSQLSCNET